VLQEIGELDSARRVCAAGLTLCRQVNDLTDLIGLLGVMADIERLAGNPAAAGGHLREAIGLAAQTGHSMRLLNLIESCGYLGAATGRGADAVTLWAAFSADGKRRGRADGPVNDHRRTEYAPQIEKALEPAQLRAAEERGARMPVAAAAELAVMVATAAQEESREPAPGQRLSRRERELVSMVAQGLTNTEIAAGLFISVRTVSSHLDRIRNKTGCRRRADLTRLALGEGLV
jgi:DNA-binding CsgD family transcriptional regulator